MPKRGNRLYPVVFKPFVKFVAGLFAHDAVRRLLVEARVRIFRFPNAPLHADKFDRIVLKIIDRFVRIIAEEAVVRPLRKEIGCYQITLEFLYHIIGLEIVAGLVFVIRMAPFSS